MKMTNSDIYVNATQLVAAFENYKQVLPIKVNFYLQKNKQTLTTLANDIENSRLEIIRTYGILSDDGEYYTIPEEKRDFVQKELEELLALEQEIILYTVKLRDLPDNIMLTTEQMEALMFMIEE